MIGFVQNGLSAVEVVICIMALILAFLVIIIIFNFCTQCCYRNTDLTKYDKNSLVDKEYYEEICALLRRYKQMEDSRSNKLPDSRLKNEIYDIGDESEYHTSEFPSKTNPESQLFELKEELEQYKIDHGIKIRNYNEAPAERRRTWGGLEDDSQFEPVELPNKVNEGVQTTGTLQRMQAARCMIEHSHETTV